MVWLNIRKRAADYRETGDRLQGNGRLITGKRATDYRETGD